METPIERKIANGIARRIAKGVAIAVAAVVGITIFIFIGGKVVQLLWNWLMPELFGVPVVTYWQALGILALCRILFGGWGGRGGHGPHRKWSKEDKEQFRQRMKERWRGHGAPANSPAGPISET